MPYYRSNRRATGEQFSDGCSVDGLRVDKALDQIVDRHNALKRGDIKTRYTRQTYSLGWEPPLEDGAAVNAEDRPATKLPFMRAYNSQDSVFGAPTPPDDYDSNGQNSWRNKGFDVTVINPTFDASVTTEAEQFVWTTGKSFAAPVIVDEIFLFLRVDGAYDNVFNYVNPPGGGLQSPATQITPGAVDFATDVVVQMQVDSQLQYNDASLADLAVNCWNWSAESMAFRAYAPTGVDMTPNTLNGFPDGAVIHLKGLNVPLPEFSRVRFSVILPWYNPAIFNVNQSWNDGADVIPWARQVYDFSFTVLEEIR